MRIALLLMAMLGTTVALAERRPGSSGERVITARVLKVEKGLLHVAVGERGSSDVIVPTDEKTAIRVDGETAKLSDLMPEMLASITQVDGITTVVECKRPQRKR